ncbi:hypothetical protein IDJ75_09285 [Mucilaginibacter rigui]|uniref:DUF4919 domain-containing protein n=1 Tax=Mucilaginibacter rigui TaxID=534635 RepID=A0ABR7X4G2_9SPHI|nr:hypothetical protein [Mucilaginibacter rigui]MBD1385468.1 hypothetical protein [Mucilaginibacter rigui]
MKHVLIMIGVVLLGTFCCYAQKTITTKPVYLKYQDSADTLYLPVVSNKSPELQKALSEKEILNGKTIAEVVSEYAECGCGITALNYDVNYFSGDIISVNLMYETMGAYPSSYQRWVTLNTKTGKPVLLSKILTAKGLRIIKARYKRILSERIQDDKNSLKDDPDYDSVIYDRLMKTVNTFNISSPATKYLITSKGILLSSDDVLPHVVQAFEPQRDVLFSYKQLMKMKYLDPNGLLGISKSR